MKYYEFTIKITDAYKDALIQKVMELGCPGVVEADELITAYFPEGLDIGRISGELTVFAAVLKNAGLGSMLSFEYCLLPDTDWNETWKKSFTPIDAGVFTILPPWEKGDSHRLSLIIDPGMAFGTGHHETTRRCLMLIESFSGECAKERFLDIGTGTGVLAIAASKSGYRHAIGVDTDPLAIDAAQRNVALNSLDNIEIKAGTLENVEGTFDFITANLISETLIAIAPELASCLNPSGIGALSGMLSGQENEVIAAIGRSGLDVIETFFDGKWVSVVARKPAFTFSSL